MSKLLCSYRDTDPKSIGGDVECARFREWPYIWSLKSQVQRGHAGTLKQWRGFVVNPIKQGQRREGMATDVVKSIVSVLRWLLQGAVNSIVALGSHAPGYSTAFCPQEDEKAHRRRGRS